MVDGQYDVIIVGGRPAGASLAIRLAQGGLHVLVVDRAAFPSPPAVPSMPVILPHTLDLLDEIGISEDIVAASGARLLRLQLEMNGHYAVEIDFAEGMAGDARRPYFYAINRELFDNEVWQHLSKTDGIEVKQGFGVTKLLQDEHGKVIGIEGADNEQYHADLVVGADGRYSFVGTQMEAKAFNEEADYNTDFYFAHWRGGSYDHADAMHTMHIYSSTRGYQYLIFPISDDEVAVSIQMIKGLIPKPADQTIEDYYESRLQDYPQLWNQIKDAERISEVRGLRNVRNAYREVGGAGWALAGDAVHFKDSIDAQGIYDALLGTRILASKILKWRNENLEWDAALQEYREELLEATYDMFLETQGRLQREVYDMTPPFVVKNILRRVMQDPTYQKQFVGYVTRRYPPKGWASPSLLLTSVLRGILRDLRR